MKKTQCLVCYGDCWRNQEENLSLKAMLGWCRKNAIKISQVKCEPLGDSTCPDYGFHIGDSKIALEVVQTATGFAADDADFVYKANEILPPFHKKINDLKSEIDKWISPHHVIYCWLSIYKPLPKKQFINFFNILNQEMRNAYEKNLFPYDWASLDLKENDVGVTVKLLPRNGEGSLVSYLQPSGTNLVPLQEDAALVLNMCIDSKNNKMANLPFDEKWLIIVPQHCLLHLDDYKAAMKNISKKCFSKMFILWKDACYQIS